MFLLLFSGFLFIGCQSQNQTSSGDKAVLKPEKNDEGEWDIAVFDSQYDLFLASRARPISMYNEEVLKMRNTALVSEWNGYFYSGRYRNIIESAIDYSPTENYGLQFEYKLYQVFAFVNWKYRLRLKALPLSEVR